MKEVCLGVFVLLVVCFGGAWLVQGNDFFLYKVFAPKYEDVRRDTFEHSKAYRDGMVKDLQSMQFDYVRASAAEKRGLAGLILQRAAGFPEDGLPGDLRAFLDDLRQQSLHSDYFPTPSTQEVK